LSLYRAQTSTPSHCPHAHAPSCPRLLSSSVFSLRIVLPSETNFCTAPKQSLVETKILQLTLTKLMLGEYVLCFVVMMLNSCRCRCRYLAVVRYVCCSCLVFSYRRILGCVAYGAVTAAISHTHTLPVTPTTIRYHSHSHPHPRYTKCDIQVQVPDSVGDGEEPVVAGDSMWHEVSFSDMMTHHYE
jgi:hypothetical protein